MDAQPHPSDGPFAGQPRRKRKVMRPPPRPVAAAQPTAEPEASHRVRLIKDPDSDRAVNRRFDVRSRNKDNAAHCRNELVRYADLVFYRHQSQPEDFDLRQLVALELLLDRLPAVIEYLREETDLG